MIKNLKRQYAVKFFLTFASRSSILCRNLFPFALFFSCFCLLASGMAMAQRRHALDVGLMGGWSYYIGDHNLREQFYQPAAVLGGLVKIGLNEHHVLRGAMVYSKLNVGNEEAVPILHIQAGYEFNFFPFDLRRPKPPYTPYVFAGVGYNLSIDAKDSETHSEGSDIALPFGVGVKYKMSNVFTVGLEWTFVKTFTDRLDGCSGEVYQSFHNNDWYSFAGITVMIRMLNNKRNCSSYL